VLKGMEKGWVNLELHVWQGEWWGLRSNSNKLDFLFTIIICFTSNMNYSPD